SAAGSCSKCSCTGADGQAAVLGGAGRAGLPGLQAGRDQPAQARCGRTRAQRPRRWRRRRRRHAPGQRGNDGAVRPLRRVPARVRRVRRRRSQLLRSRAPRRRPGRATARMTTGLDPASTPEAAHFPPESYRAALRWLATSRVAVALLLLTFLPLQEVGRFAARLDDPVLFERAAVVYLLAAIVFLSTLHRFHARFHSMLVVHALTDLVALATMMHAAGGLRGGVVVLLIAALAGAAIVSTRRMAASFAAVATLLVLLEAGWALLRGGEVEGVTVMAGLVGIACFATAMTVNWLATRLYAQEQIASRRGDDLRRQLAVTSRVVAELQQGVLIVGGDGQVRTRNPAPRARLGAGGRLPALADPGSLDGGGGWSSLRRAYARWRDEPAGRHAEAELVLPAIAG